MTPENLLTEWARLLFESFADVGLSDVVISPGSRSTPLAWAALRSPRLRCTSVVDERSAGFFALGMAKATGRAAAVVCTSGSAAANYFPAVVEASLARIPLLVLTADRPFELQDCAASQTLDQIKLYGDHVRRFVELGMPEGDPSALLGVRRRAIQSVLETTSGEPGPVHVNVRARKPLEPASGVSEGARELTTRVDALLRVPAPFAPGARRVARDESIELLAAACRGAERGVIVCGPSALDAAGLGSLVARLSGALHFPVFAETTSQLRFDGTTELTRELTLDGLDTLLRSAAFRDAFRPDVVLQLGEPPVSNTWERFIGAARGVSRHVLAPHGFPDPHGLAASLTVADVADTLERLLGALGARSSESRESQRAAWVRALASANDAAWTLVDESVSSEPGLSEGSAVRAVVAALPASALLAVGNSLPVRHVDAYCRARPAASVGVCSQRGVAGIDGVVSSAAGSARASARPTVLIVGDVSALHDLGGFAVAAETDTPLVVVVLNNDGGRIFEQLPLADRALPGDELRFWTTPHGANFDGLARLFRLEHVRVTTLAELDVALTRGLAKRGATVVEVVVPPHGARELQGRIATRVDEAMRRLFPPNAAP